MEQFVERYNFQVSNINFRSIILKDGNVYLCQVLEHDIVCQSISIDQLKQNIKLTVMTEFNCLDKINCAPTMYHNMYEMQKIVI